MRRLAVLIGLAALPAVVQDKPVVLYLENRSDRMIEQVAIFGVSATGEVVDDVLMARHDPIASNETVALDTRLLRCMPISVWARMSDGEEMSAITDLCRNDRLIVHD